MASAENRFRKIEIRMWTDQKFRELSPMPPSGQSLWFYLLSGPHTSIIPGLFRARRSGIAEELAWTPEAFDTAFKEIASQQMAEADWQAGVVWIPNAIKCNPPQSPNVITAWRKEWPLIPECDLKTKALEAMRSTISELVQNNQAYCLRFNREFGEPSGKPSAKPMSNQEQEQEQLAGTGNKENPLSEQSSDEEGPSTRRSKQPSGEACRLAALLKSEIHRNEADFRITPKQERNWAVTAQRMIDLDDRKSGEIEELIRWAQRHEFWRTNILSMGKLREKFDMLQMKCRSQGGESQHTGSISGSGKSVEERLAEQYRKLGVTQEQVEEATR
jgi:hypothetical protein